MNPDLATALQEHLGICVDLATSCADQDEAATTAEALRNATTKLRGLYEALNGTQP